MKKERIHTRKRTDDYFLVKHCRTHQIIGRIANISLGGLMLIATKPLTVHRDYELQLLFPTTLFEREWIAFTAESRWSKYNNRTDWWEVGFEIRKIEPEDIHILQQIIQQLMMDERPHMDSKRPLESEAAPKLEYIKAR